ncbi:TNT domain-containing protein [Curtobacterium flaccumfaciens pv. betae]|uniref:hypothetical protein n=1 Tax=Curtobacterium flaccumfaciens TaxID=2035 RepID=UPI001597D172|nr:hypothetical protein [Curtobacterium flaccumfaciens]MCS5512592.1 TNT domain-containing protein [Curtobacterium flaccumfaciens pv. betae]QKS88101.1 hypothetical protein FK523_11540 [Curtobacterium flaccumfaciens pv. flaccumfaciens]
MHQIDALRHLADAEAAGAGLNWLRAPHNDVNVSSLHEADGRWVVSTTNERATEESVHEYADRAAAIEDFVSRIDKELVNALLQQRNKTADDLGSLGAYRGEIAAVGRFGSPGGGVQVQLPLPVEILQVLGVLREIPLH